MSSSNANEKFKNASGGRSPEYPPEDSAPIDILTWYLKFYESDYARRGTTSKARARRAIVWPAVLAGAISVLGAVIAATQLSSLGWLSAALSGTIAVIVAWDNLFRHRDLWQRERATLHRITALRRKTGLSISLGESKEEVARDGMAELQTILDDDQRDWTDLRKKVTKAACEAAAPKTE